MPLDPAVILTCGDVHGDGAEVDYCLTVAGGQAGQTSQAARPGQAGPAGSATPAGLATPAGPAASPGQAAQAVFFLGDFGYWEHEQSGVTYLDQVEKLAAGHDLPVYFLDGNHDKISLLLDRYPERDDEGFIIVRPHVRYAPRGHRWTWSGVRFVSFGGAYSIDKEPRLLMEQRRARYQDLPQHALAGTLWFPEEEATDADLQVALDGPPVDVLLTHDKPRRSQPAINRKDEWEAYPNQERIQRLVDELQPKLLVHGHLHYRYSDQLGPTRVEGLACDQRAAWGMPGYTHADLHLRIELADLADQAAWTVRSPPS